LRAKKNEEDNFWNNNTRAFDFFNMSFANSKINARPKTYSDDFSTDSGMWGFLGSSYRDPVNQYLVLTEMSIIKEELLFFNTTFGTSFTANFSYKSSGGSVCFLAWAITTSSVAIMNSGSRAYE